MNFLLPAAWGFLALAIPITLLYLIKTRLQRRVVSTSLFWQQLSPQVYNTSLWRRLRRWLSLVLQLLFLVLLAFALTQPLGSWQSLQPASMVVVLDPSVSMAATDVTPSRWSRAVQLAEQRIRQMRAFDEATLIVASEPPQILSSWASSKRALLRALEKAEMQQQRTDVRPALQLAKNLAEGREHGSVVLFTDGVWQEPPPKELLAGVNIQWVDGDATNAGITLFTARRAFSGPGEFQLAARVEAREAVSGTLEAYRDGRLMDAQAITLEPGTPWEKTWDGRADQGTRFEAQLKGFPGDHLAADDHAQALLAGQSVVTVELIAPPNGFLDAALMSLSQVKWKRTWPAKQLGAASKGTLYVFYRSVPPPDFGADAVVLIDPPAGGFWGELRGAIDAPMVSDFKRESPLLRHAGIENVKLEAARKFAPPGSAEILAESFGDPLIFGKWSGGQRWLVLPFDLESSDLVLRTAFPILLGNITTSLRTESAVTSPVQVPGSIETALARNVASESLPKQEGSGTLAVSWWSSHPLWWWAVLAGLLWLLAEWWSFSRRITE